MTLDELSGTLPNGFHDARCHGLEIDYGAHTARLALELWVGHLDAPGPTASEAYRRAELLFSGVVYFVIESSKEWQSGPLSIDAGSDYGGVVPTMELPASIPEDAFRCWIFVQQWNEFIHVAARHVEVVFAEDESSGPTLAR